MTRSRLLRHLEVVAIGAIAALYFHGAIGSTIGLNDEGVTVYASWLVATGAIPYVDFQHLYGPSVFFLNGALLHAFGPDLRVIRLSLVGIKALIVVLVYLLAGWVAPRRAALLVCAFLTAMWGAPMWAFNAPYATYYATACTLAAVLIAGGRRSGGRWLACGLCLGIAATFKQTQGPFAFLALMLFTIFSSPSRVGRTKAGTAARLAGYGRVLALVGAIGIGVAYVADHLETVTAWVLLLPLFVSAVTLIVREVATWPPDAGAVNSIRLLLAASAGMAIPCLAYAALYARIGALDALFYNTLRLPQRMTWFVPFRAPGWPHAWLYSTIACSVVVLCEWQARRRRGVLALGAAALTVSAAAALLAARAAPGLGAYLLRAGWTNEMLPLLPVFPILVLGWAVITSLGDPARRSGAEPAEAHRHRLALLFFFGFTAILLLYPAADIPHGAMLMPAFLPLAAYGLSWRGRPVGGATLALVALWLAGAAWPFLGPRLTAPPEPAGGLPTFARASGIVRADQRMIDVSRLVRRLSEAGAHDRGLLVIVDEPMLYFLADAVSALPREEFVLFLVGSGLVEDGVARSLVDESASIDRLAGSRPLVVDYPDSIEEGRFRRVFPRIAAFIDARYRPAAAVGGYRILAPDGAPSRSR